MSAQSRRRVTFTQLETLWEYLSCHKELITGYHKFSQAREHSRRLWSEVADHLNSIGDGAVKDWKAWNKFWNEYKSKNKKMAAAAKSSRSRTGGSPSTAKPMTNLDLEKKFLDILGPDFGDGLPGMRVEPFEDIPPSQITTPFNLVTQEEPGPSWRTEPLSQTPEMVQVIESPSTTPAAPYTPGSSDPEPFRASQATETASWTPAGGAGGAGGGARVLIKFIDLYASAPPPAPLLSRTASYKSMNFINTRASPPAPPAGVQDAA